MGAHAHHLTNSLVLNALFIFTELHELTYVPMHFTNSMNTI